MSADPNAGQRKLPNLPQNLSQMPWNAGRTAIYIFLLALRNYIVGIPGGWKNTTPPYVLIGGAPSAGSQSAGWVAANAVYAALSGTPEGLGNANEPGESTAAPRLDHVHKRDVRVFMDGDEIATRNALNFIGAEVVDDEPNDRIDITAGGGDAELLAWIGL